jgi:hypothetical protein
LRRVESHVERTGVLKAETAALVGQLVGRKAQIEQHSVDAVDAQSIQDVGQLCITGLLQSAASIGQNQRRSGEHHWIAIESDEFSGRTKVFEKNAAVTAGSDCSVHDNLSRRNVEKLNDFAQENRTMNGRAGIPRGTHRIRHCDGLVNEGAVLFG